MQCREIPSRKQPLSALALAVGAAATGLAAPSSVQAAPYVHVSVVGRIQGSGQPFASSVAVAPGDVVEYQLQALLGVEGAVNQYAGNLPTSSTKTITNWVPSNGSTEPTAGLNSLIFNLGQTSPAGIQADFDAPATAAPGWANSGSASGGNVTPRGNGNDELRRLVLIRFPGDMTGIGPDEQPHLMTVAGGVFDITSGGSPSTVLPHLSGSFVTTNVILGMRWRDATNTTNVSYNATWQQQSNSTSPANPDPIVVYHGLTLLPEPAGFGAVLLAAAALGSRRRRPAN